MVGLGTLILGLGISGIMALGQGPFGFWMSSLVMVELLGLAALVLPFAVASSWGRF
jgi:hypothetical protein